MMMNPAITQANRNVRFSGASLAPRQRQSASVEPRNRHDERGSELFSSAVEIAPRDLVARRIESRSGLAAEVVHTTQRERIDIRYQGPLHLLVIAEEGVRVAGESTVEGLPRSTLRDLSRKLTFVPAGRSYHEWSRLSMPSRFIYFYFDPATMPGDVEDSKAATLASPRLFFEDGAILQTAIKLRRMLDAPGPGGELYFDALAVILAHELTRTTTGPSRSEPRNRGGLAGWQQRTLIEFIENNLGESIPLTSLAQLVNLSPYHFCRAFKQSLGVPPHRYHTMRRIERAKALLANPNDTVTNIGLAVGFSETSSFTSVFRKITGVTPTAYRRSLV